MRIGYFDCWSGVSGDMILGALVDAGLQVDELRQGIAALNLPGLGVRASQVKRGAFIGTKVDVLTGEGRAPDHPHQPRDLRDIVKILEGSSLPSGVLATARRVFERLAEAEAAAHGIPVSHVHFHEVGALDAIADVVGAIYGLHLLAVEAVEASPVNLGGGTIRATHGIMPVPAPGTLALLKAVPVYGTPVEAELTTPTGAAILTTVARAFGPLPPLTLRAVGYGAGSREIPGWPNFLRFAIGEQTDDIQRDEVTVIEANIDDMNPQLYEPLMEELLRGGALDVFLTPIIMKKSRPATQVSVLAPPGAEDRLIRLLLLHSSTFGIRHQRMARQKLFRECVGVRTPYGEIRVQVGRLDGRVVKLSPEYEDCRRAATIHDTAVDVVLEAARAAARGLTGGGPD